MFRVLTYNTGVMEPLNNLSESQRQLLDRYLSRRKYTLGLHIPAGLHHVDIYNAKLGDYVEYQFTLNHDLIYRGKFDPSIVAPDTKPTLNVFLKQVALSKFLSAGLHCFDSLGGSSQPMDLYDLAYGLAVREKPDGTANYDILDQSKAGILGKGAFGVVYSISGSLKPGYTNAEQLFFSDGQGKRVAKVLSAKYEGFTRELSLMRRANYFKVRDLKFPLPGEESLGLMSMARFNGYDLDTLLNRDAKKIAELTVKDRVNLSIKMLRELRRLHDKKILHRDIKPENLLVQQDKITGSWDVHFIDLGLSVSSEIKEIRPVGTAYYIAPEIYDDYYTEKSDLYSLARLIGLVWRDKNLYKFDDTSISVSEFIKLRITQRNIDFELFDGIDLHEQMKVLITSAIKWMTAFDSQHRLSLSRSIREFEDIRLANFEHTCVNTECYLDVRDAHFAAMCLADKLDALLLTDGMQSGIEIKKLIVEAIKDINNDSQSVLMFIETLDIKAFYGCESTMDLIAKTNDVILSLSDSYTACGEKIGELSQLHAEMCDSYLTHNSILASELKRHLMECDAFMIKISTSSSSIDSMVEMTSHMNKKIAKLSDAIVYYQQNIISSDDIYNNKKVSL